MCGHTWGWIFHIAAPVKFKIWWIFFPLTLYLIRESQNRICPNLRPWSNICAYSVVRTAIHHRARPEHCETSKSIFSQFKWLRYPPLSALHPCCLKCRACYIVLTQAMLFFSFLIVLRILWVASIKRQNVSTKKLNGLGTQHRDTDRKTEELTYQTLSCSHW